MEKSDFIRLKHMLDYDIVWEAISKEILQIIPQLEKLLEEN